MRQETFNSTRGSGTGSGRQGRGLGRYGGTKAGAGPEGYCVCPSCGEEISHKIGVPCQLIKCPKCNTPMKRK